MTPLWTAEALARATGGRFTLPFAATGISIDTRSLAPGDLFIALRGQTDGHAHVAASLAAGAAGAMVAYRPQGLPDSAPLLLVADGTDAALTRLGAAGRARASGPVVAVTGSVGKTTTKDMLRLTLGAHGPAHASAASHNNHWGVPLTLARLPPAAAAAIEIGMNHAGEIAPLARITRPDIALITHIGTAHIGQLGSVAAIAREKASLATGLAPGGIFIVPDATGFDPLFLAAAGAATLLRFGETGTADTSLLSLSESAGGSVADLQLRTGRVRVRLAAPGRHLVSNALAALTATEAAGFDIQAAAARLEAYRPGQGRGLQHQIAVPGGVARLLDESYNASTASIRAALHVLSLQPAGRRIAILGDMRELGSESAAAHLALLGPVRDAADLVFACGAEMRTLFDALPSHQQGAHALTAEALAPLVASALRPGDAVLVKGSHGMNLAALVAALLAAPAGGVAA